MAKRHQDKLNHKSTRKATSITSLKKRPMTKFKVFGIALWKIIVGLIIILGGIATYEPIRNIFLSPKEKYEKENFIEGDLKPDKISETSEHTELGYTLNEVPPVFINNPNEEYPIIRGLLLKNFYKNDHVRIFLGSRLFMVPKDALSHGVSLNIPMGVKCGNFKITFGVKDSRLYVSVEFKDLQNEQTIGIIEFNHWRLYKPNLFDFKNDDKRLEVKDKQNNIVFSIECHPEPGEG